MFWRRRANYFDWRNGKVPYLERVCKGNLSQLSFVLDTLSKFASEHNLEQSYTYYKQWGKTKQPLYFSKTRLEHLEKKYATHFVKRDLGCDGND